MFEKCKVCDLLGVDTVPCLHPRYKDDCVCPLPVYEARKEEKKCNCDNCTCEEDDTCDCFGKREAVVTMPEFFPVSFDCGCDNEKGCDCGTKSRKNKKQASWDKYFMAMCEVTATNGKCFSRKIGAVIVKDKAVLSSGYNGPPRGIPQCYEKLNLEQGLMQLEEPCCPRQKLGAKSGTMLNLCYAQHAERNAITQAARNGTSINGATLYLNDTIPCKDCLGAIINAGIVEIVCTKLTYYDADDQGKWLLDNCDILVRVPYGE